MYVETKETNKYDRNKKRNGEKTRYRRGKEQEKEYYDVYKATLSLTHPNHNTNDINRYIELLCCI